MTLTLARSIWLSLGNGKGRFVSRATRRRMIRRGEAVKRFDGTLALVSPPSAPAPAGFFDGVKQGEWRARPSGPVTTMQFQPLRYPL